MDKKIETIAIRSQMDKSKYKEHSSPLYLTSSYVFNSAEEGAALFKGDSDGYMYARVSNPNADEFAEKLAQMEGAEMGISTASGMAAIFTALAVNLNKGDHVIASKAIFGSTGQLIKNVFTKWGVEYSFVGIHDTTKWEKSFKPNTKAVFVETPANPTLDLIDIEMLSKLCHANHALLIVDNCFATPYLQQPFRLGADVVVHSATKFLDGQGRVMGGAILGKKEIIEKCRDFIRMTGPVLSTFNSWLLSKSLETLAVRMERHCNNAFKLAKHLENHAEIENVIYPFLPSFKQHQLAKKQMRLGGGLVGCTLKGGIQQGPSFLNHLQMHSLTANLGDSRSIATHPASTTHFKLTAEEQAEIGITPGFIRFSTGLEHIDDIIADIDQALLKSKQ